MFFKNKEEIKVDENKSEPLYENLGFRRYKDREIVYTLKKENSDFLLENFPMDQINNFVTSMITMGLDEEKMIENLKKFYKL